MSKVKTFITESSRVLLPLGILALGLGGFVVFGQKPEGPGKQEAKKVTTVVRVAPAIAFADTFALNVEGQVVPYQSIKLSSEISGKITDIEDDCRAGLAVKKGQKLLTIDESDYQLELKRTTADRDLAKQKRAELEVQIANAKNSLAVTTKEFELQQAELQRSLDLYRDNVITDTELDRAKIQVLTSETALQNLKNQLALLEAQRKTLELQEKLAQVQMDRAQLNVDRTSISSPVSGSLTSVQVEENDFVQMGAVVVTLISSEKMEVQCSLRLEELAWILEQAGLEVLKTLQEGTGFELPPTKVNVLYEFQGRTYSWEGTLARFEGVGMDQKTRTVPCRVVVDQPTAVTLLNKTATTARAVGPPSLFSGMYVTIEVPIKPARKLISLPLDGLRPGNLVWVSEETALKTHKLKIRKVNVARIQKERVLIYEDASELKPGEQVVVSPVPLVTDEMEVQVQPDEKPITKPTATITTKS